MKLTYAAGVVAAFLGTIVAANYAVTEWPDAPVGFGLTAPAGVYFAGLAFILRDELQDVGGRVAGVEVSTDGGTTWHAATGTTS